MLRLPWLEIRKQLFAPTKDNWYSNYPGERVLITLSEAWHPNRPDQYDLHLSFFGTGSFGVHRWIKADSYNYISKRNKLLCDMREFPRPISIKWLLDHKFKYC